LPKAMLKKLPFIPIAFSASISLPTAPWAGVQTPIVAPLFIPIVGGNIQRARRPMSAPPAKCSSHKFIIPIQLFFNQILSSSRIERLI
jgi:hypothetical protein